MQSKKETITPAIAKKLLVGNTRNVRISSRKVAQFAADMAAGKWALTGEPIIIAKGGLINTGQHRLHAVIASNTPIVTFVTRGADPDDFRQIDVGSKPAAAILDMLGVKNPTKTAAAARLAINYRNGDKINAKPSRIHITEFVEQNPYIAEVTDYCRASKVVPSSTLAAVIFLATADGSNRDRVMEFIAGVVDGAMMDVTDPRYQLRDEFIRLKNVQKRVQGEDMSALPAVAQAWNAWVANAPLKRVKIGMKNPHATPIAGYAASAIKLAA